MLVVVAPDKFRGTVSAPEAAAALAAGVRAAGATCDEVPMADGGEGTLEALGGANRTTLVHGPLGEPVEAAWRLDRDTAVIEMARASGMALVGDAEANDAVEASTTGTGELLVAALDAGARRIVVGVGGSATTDGGLGALRAIGSHARLRGVELLVACDVRTRFVDAATSFAPQKGASPAQVELLVRRLDRLVQVYRDERGVDVSELPGAGAAGGLAGGLAALGARLVSGFELIADEVLLADRVSVADLVITGEGFIDAESFEGKVVGGVVALAAQESVAVAAVAGRVYDGAEARLPCISLVERFGEERALNDTVACLHEAAFELTERALRALG